jgi:chemotaxis family two-component system response regulator Rcp1
VSALRVLIVEDNPADIFLYRRTLLALDSACEIEVLADGEQALEFVHDQRKYRHDPRPCVILLDLHLPKHNGMEVLRAIRDQPVMNHIHVVIVSSLASPSDTAEMQSFNADFRLKPNSLAEFEQLAADVIAICKGLHIGV